jgi:fucose permease
LLVYLGSCGIEAIVLGYGSTFLTQSHSLTPATAAAIITYYYLGMTLGRALSGLISKKFRSEQILIMGEAITCVAVLLLLVSGTPFLAGFGLFLVGLGNGPVFPNMTHLAPIHYGKSKSQAFIGLQGAVSYASFMMLPVITGQLIQRLGSGTFPWILTVTMVLTVVATLSTLQIHSTKSSKE